MNNTREQYLDFNIKLTEQLFGVKFIGSTLEDKEEFVMTYKEQRNKEVQNILTEMYDEYTK